MSSGRHDFLKEVVPVILELPARLESHPTPTPVIHHAPNVSEKLLLTVPEAAERLGMSGRRLYTLIAQGVVPDVVVIRLGRSIKISVPRLMRWLGADGLQWSEALVEGSGDAQTSSQALSNRAPISQGIGR